MTNEATPPADGAAPIAPNRERDRVPITELDAATARQFFLKNKSYCGIDLPDYFDFAPLLEEVSSKLEHHPLTGMSKDVRSIEAVNHTILTNKGRGHDWRPLQLMHPALYVQLVNNIIEGQNWATICDVFENFKSNGFIECSSIPISTTDDERAKEAQINSWWQYFEQRSIELAIEYEYIARSDIVDCHSSLYTHGISWAIHGKDHAKKHRHDKKMIGNVIDTALQDMHMGQTNGIPQGSTLSNFIAEIVLGYVDLHVIDILRCNKGIDFRILRYRDDYRIFTHSKEDASFALRCLSETARDVGWKLNASKTDVTDDIISASMKEEKTVWLQRRPRRSNPLDTLVDIRRHSLLFPDAGSVRTSLSRFHRRVENRKKPFRNTRVLASVVLDIAMRNPSTYPHVASILSVFIDLLRQEGHEAGEELAADVLRKFGDSPNSGHMEVWLQRVLLPTGADHKFHERLCWKVMESDLPLWNSEWITNRDMRKLIDTADVVNREILERKGVRIASEEVDLFGAFGY